MKKFVVISLLSLFISACGGSKDSSPKVDNPTPKPGATEYQVPEHLKNEVSAIKRIRINDTTLDLNNEPVGFFTKSTTEYTQARVYNQVYSVIGYIQPIYTSDRVDRAKQWVELIKLPSDKRSYSNSIDTKFENIPTASEAIYSGVALSYDLEGSLRLYADFANKTVSGQINNLRKMSSREQQPGFELRETSIRQFPNSPSVHFSGVAARSDGSIHGYAGGFAGPNAEEVIGVIANPQDKAVLEFIGKK